jgi:eukaryotic-like serine/threonine-protein kinase
MLERVRRGDFPPPRSIVRTVPAALEAVCLKAMARDPALRYDSPGALARDVERWLADEPVSAHAAPWQERLGRWGRRHRRAVQIGAAALVVVTAVSVGAALAVHAAKRQVMLEHGATRTALAAEQAAKNEARRAIDSFVNVVTEGEPPRDARGRALRARLLSEALKYYEELIGKYGDDEHLRHDLASAILRVGRINQQTGARAEALEAFREAQTLFKELAQRHPLESHYQTELAASHLGVAALHREMGRSREAVVQLRAAADVLERLVKRDESDYRFQRQLATAYEQLAAVERELHEAAASEHATRASEIRRRLSELERFPHRTEPAPTRTDQP